MLRHLAFAALARGRTILAAVREIASSAGPPAVVVPPADTRWEPRDACELCDVEPTTDVREVRIPHHGVVTIRVCARHARVAPTTIIGEIERAIEDEFMTPLPDGIYGTRSYEP